MAPADVEKFEENMVRFFNLYLDLVEAGVDWLAETSRACRQRGVALGEHPDERHARAPQF